MAQGGTSGLGVSFPTPVPHALQLVMVPSHRPLLVLRKPDEATEVAARQMQISIVRSVHEAVGLLLQPAPASRVTMVDRILKLLRVV